MTRANGLYFALQQAADSEMATKPIWICELLDSGLLITSDTLIDGPTDDCICPLSFNNQAMRLHRCFDIRVSAINLTKIDTMKAPM